MRRRTTLAALAALTFALPATLAQPPGSLDYAKRLQELADSRATADATNAINAADKAGSPAKAIRDLKTAILNLDKSVELSSAKRAELVKSLQAKINTLEGKPEAPKPLKPADIKQVAEAATAETKAVRDGLAEVQKLYSLDKFADAQGVINTLTRDYPNNPAVIALSGQGYVSDRVAEAAELSRQQAERVNLALNDVLRSALPAKGDIEFPKGWAEKMEARDRSLYEQIDDETLAILEALEKRVETGIPSGPFEEVVQQLATTIDKTIYLDPNAMQAAGLDSKKLVSMPGGVSARTALRAVLQANRMTFIIKDKAILAVTPEEASKMLVKRAYYMGDVLSTPLGGGATLGPLVDFNLSMQNAQLIIDSIKKSVDPLGWQNPAGGGGNSSILFHAPSLSIIVSAPAEVHYSIGQAVRPKKK